MACSFGRYRTCAVAILINEPSWNLVYHLNTPDRLLHAMSLAMSGLGHVLNVSQNCSRSDVSMNV